MVVSRKKFTKRRAGLVRILYNSINTNTKPMLLTRSHIVDWVVICCLLSGERVLGEDLTLTDHVYDCVYLDVAG